MSPGEDSSLRYLLNLLIPCLALLIACRAEGDSSIEFDVTVDATVEGGRIKISRRGQCVALTRKSGTGAPLHSWQPTLYAISHVLGSGRAFVIQLPGVCSDGKIIGPPRGYIPAIVWLDDPKNRGAFDLYPGIRDRASSVRDRIEVHTISVTKAARGGAPKGPQPTALEDQLTREFSWRGDGPPLANTESSETLPRYGVYRGVVAEVYPKELWIRDATISAVVSNAPRAPFVVNDQHVTLSHFAARVNTLLFLDEPIRWGVPLTSAAYGPGARPYYQRAVNCTSDSCEIDFSGRGVVHFQLVRELSVGERPPPRQSRLLRHKTLVEPFDSRTIIVEPSEEQVINVYEIELVRPRL